MMEEVWILLALHSMPLAQAKVSSVHTEELASGTMTAVQLLALPALSQIDRQYYE